MSRFETIMTLVKTFSMEGEALAYPDHPLVLDGPSLLTVVNQSLRATFVYTRNSRPADLVTERARVMLARLAYPRHTLFEAIFVDSAMPDSGELGLFDSFRMMSENSLSRPDGNEESRSLVASAVEDLRGPHFSRFAANQRGFIENHAERAQPTFVQFRSPALPRYKFVDEGIDGPRATVPHSNRARTVDRLQRVAEAFTASDYGLGLGISALADVAGALSTDFYLKQHPVRTYVSSEGGRVGIDVNKPIRAAQFAGGLVKNSW